MRARLVDDHRLAKRLAEGLCRTTGTTLPTGAPDTNIVIIRVAGAGAAPAKAICEGLKRRGILALPAGPDRLRFVTHFDVDEDDVLAAIAAYAESVPEVAHAS
jgi:threonine aldolase